MQQDCPARLPFPSDKGALRPFLCVAKLPVPSKRGYGQRAGLCTLSVDYTRIGVARDGGRRRIVFGKGDATGGPAPRVEGPLLDQDELWLRLDYREAKGTLSYSLNGRDFMPLGPRDHAYRSFWYEGTKVGLFSYRLSTAGGEGVADFDFLRQDHDGPDPAGR